MVTVNCGATHSNTSFDRRTIYTVGPLRTIVVLATAAALGACVLSAGDDQPQVVASSPYDAGNDAERRLVRLAATVCERIRQIDSDVSLSDVVIRLVKSSPGTENPQLRALLTTRNGTLLRGGTILLDATYWLDARYPQRASEENLLMHLPGIVIDLEYEGPIRVCSRRRLKILTQPDGPDTIYGSEAVYAAVGAALRRFANLKAGQLAERLLSDYFSNSNDPAIRVERIETMTESVSGRSRPTKQHQRMSELVRQVGQARRAYITALEELAAIAGQPRSMAGKLGTELEQALKTELRGSAER